MSGASGIGDDPGQAGGGGMPARRHHTRAVLGSLWEFAPAPGSFRLAVRMSFAVLVSLSILTLCSRLEWSAFAMFGTLAGLYGGTTPTSRRWRTQAGMGMLFTLAVVSGTLAGLSPQRTWVALPLCAVWAAASALLSDRYRWRPAGPLFPVFAVSTCASIPSSPDDLLPAVLVAAVAVAFAVGLALTEASLLRSRAAQTSIPSQPAALTRRDAAYSARYAVAVLVAGTIANACGIAHPGWAMVAAVVPLGATELHAQFSRALHRIVGTLAGLLPAGLLLALGLPPMGTVAALTALQLGVDSMIARHYALALFFVTPVPLLLTQLGDPQPPVHLLTDRLVETVIGVTVGTLAAVLTSHSRTTAR